MTFWSISENGGLSPELIQLYDFLSKRGYMVKQIGSDLKLFRKNTHFVEEVNTNDLINEVIKYLSKEYKEVTERIIERPRAGDLEIKLTPIEVLEKITKYGYSKIFCENNWNNLKPFDLKIKRHIKGKAFFYFRNGYVEITKDTISLNNYSLIKDSFIYKDLIIDRDIKVIDINNMDQQQFASNGACFYNFLGSISGFPENLPSDDKDLALWGNDIANYKALTEAESKLKYLMQLLGYLAHDYKQQGLTDYAIIFCDDEGGGSGKGLLIQALKKLTTVCAIDCKRGLKQFDPKELTERTRIKVYNDVMRSFPFERIYNEVTDGGCIEYKNGHEVLLNYCDTWKTALTSNHVIKGSNESDLRRQKVFNLTPFFNSNKTIQSYYNHSFFSEDWKNEDWTFFYNVMFKCVQLWLQSDYKVIYKDEEYESRKIEASYQLEFREYVDLIEGGQYYKTGELFENFKNNDKYRTSPTVRNMNSTLFGRLLVQYLKDAGRKFHKKSNRIEIWIDKKR